MDLDTRGNDGKDTIHVSRQLVLFLETFRTVYFPIFQEDENKFEKAGLLGVPSFSQ